MARLPEIGLQARGGTDPASAAVRPTDFGLGAAAQSMDAWSREREQTDRLAEEAQAAEDDRYAEGVVQAFSQDYEPRFSEQGAGWTGSGFARSAFALYDVAEAPTRRGDGETRTEGQQAAVERRLDAYRTAMGQRAISFDAALNGQRITQQRAAAETAQVNAAYAGFLTAFAEPFAALTNGFDGTSPTFEDDVMAAHAAAAAEAVASLPEHLQPVLSQRLSADGLQRLASAQDVRQRTSQALIVSEYEASSEGLVNAVRTSPALFEGIEPSIEALVATLPAAERPAARRGLYGAAAEARIEGLIATGETDQAREELASGQYDEILSPSARIRLAGRADQESRGSIVEQLAVQDWIESDVRSMAETGQGAGEGYSLDEIERILGPEAAARYSRQLAEAEVLSATFSGWEDLSLAEITREVEALAPETGAADYARQADRYELALQRLQAERTRREDPGGWAQSDGATGDLFAAISEAETVEQARAAARTFAAASLTRQRAADVPLAEQRLLSVPQAQGLVASYEGSPDRGEGLRELAGFLGAFQPRANADATERRAARARQSMLIRELIRAGGDPADIAAALYLSDDPVGLGAYVAAVRDPPNLDRADQRSVAREVAEALGPWMDSQPAGDRMVLSAQVAMIERLAARGVAQGQSAGDAARRAADRLTAGFRFVGRDGFRLPEARRSDEGRIERGAAAALRGYSANDGARFYTPSPQQLTALGVDAQGMTAEQRRDAYADHVASRGRWVTTPDDQGLMLMTPDLQGGWIGALNSQGRAIAYDWDQLEAHGRASGVGGLRPVAPPAVRGTSGGGSGGGGGGAPARVTPASATGADRGTGGRQPLGVRQNNPGNLRDSGDAWQGMTGVANGFLTFRTPEHGLRALGINLLTYHGRGLDTVEEIITRFAPRSENDTGAYIAAVSRALGVRPDATLDLRNETVLTSLMTAIARHENGGDFFPLRLIAGGARAALSRGR